MHPSDATSVPANAQHFEPDDLRYSKEQLLEIYKSMDLSQTDPASLYTPNWNPSHVNGSASRGWGKSGDSQHVPQDPSVCWNPNGDTRPVSLEDMSPEEREMFMTDVNSTLKLPQQTKDGNQGGGQNGRKSSISLGSTNHPISSPSTASRPGTRRRETADTNPFSSGPVASPTTGRFSNDPWSLPRRSTELKEEEDDEDVGGIEPTRSKAQLFPARSNTTGSTGFGSSSLWSNSGSTSGMAFGGFGLNTPAIGDKRFGSSGSRLAHLIPKESSENLGARANDPNADNSRWRNRQRTDTDPFNGEAGGSGSAILGGAPNNSPPSMNAQPHRGGIYDTPLKGSTSDFGMSGLHLGHGDGNGPASPSETNPYRSPMADRVEDGSDGHEGERQPQTGSEPASHYGTLPRTFGASAFEGSDRSQTSSVGAKGFASVNPLAGWPSAGTPDRERPIFNAFGSSIFNPHNDLPSPGLGGLGGVFGPPGPSAHGRGSKLGSLFPAAMQVQMHGQDHDNLSDSVPDLRQVNPLGAIGRGPIGTQPREGGSPVRQNRGVFEDMFPADAARAAFTSADRNLSGLTATAHQDFSTSGAPPFSTLPASTDPASTRTMVMPDRMRWVYLDPMGIIQGPFNGLEMNDWYKANFFTPDLRVRRLEDPDFEPLGQLIRRIGNSREPFLVPQMGIAHGLPPSTPYASEAVPPLQSAFPSFGRTLTAAQQNDLERRKQEEQLYHARQREIAHHSQPFGRNPILPGAPSSLHHTSSLQSLHSQPSFGSMASPIGAPQPPIGPLGPNVPNAPFFDGPTSLGIGQGSMQPGVANPSDIYNPDLNPNERQLLASMQVGSGLGSIMPPQPTAAPGNDSTGLRSQLPPIDQLQRDNLGFSARIKEFHDLRAQHDAEEAANAAAAATAAKAVLPEVEEEEDDEPVVPAPVERVAEPVAVAQEVVATRQEQHSAKKTSQSQSSLSLTEKIKKTQAAQADAAAAAAAVVAAVAKPSQQPSSGMPLPFPPPAQSSTPIQAPLAQRPGSNLPTRYDERSASGTPDTSSDGVSLAPPPTAPWAGTETQKGPSLKEIQEAEAKKAAKREELAAAQRRAALEQEMAQREREKAAAAVIGLPATSTWGTGSPVGAAAAGSPWKQPTTAKGAAAGGSSTGTPSKKTLAEIQREEEHRKQKALQAQAMQTAGSTGSGLGKRYADFAGKTSAPPGISSAATAVAAAAAAVQVSSGGGWATVGAGGKVKVPTGPAAQTRSASVGTVKPLATPTRPAAKPAMIGLKDAKGMAMEEFKKWLNQQLSRGLIGVHDHEAFASALLEMPLETSIISEAVYQCSTTMDGRHFAEEFVRRKKLADKGMFDKEPVTASTSETKNTGGWNEVAKKTTAPKEDTNSSFRVVPSKKKGKKTA
ncbi:hypothetical protein OQA88_10573 [Cercophora sp. LCS_1]